MTWKACFRFNIRTLVGTFMAVISTVQLTVWPIVTKVAASYSNSDIVDEKVWGWSVFTALAGAALLAWGEFCEKGDC